MKKPLLIAGTAVAAFVLVTTGCSSSSTSSPAASTTPSSAGATQFCTQIDSIMANNPDTDPTATAAALNKIKDQAASNPELQAKIAAAAEAFAAYGSDHSSTNGETLKSASGALGAACQSATQSP